MNAMRFNAALLAACLSLAAAEQASAFYAPHMGRFTSRDPNGETGRIGLETPPNATAAATFVDRDPYDPMTQYGDGMNLYAYVGNNPSIQVDPLGEQAGVPGWLLDRGYRRGWNPPPREPEEPWWGPYVGAEGHFILGGGISKVTCCKNGRERIMYFSKICIGGAAGISSSLGAHNLGGDTCDPSFYTGWFFEAGGSAGLVGGGVDVGYNDWSDNNILPGGFSGTVEGGFGPSIGVSFKASWCRYYFISEEQGDCCE